MSSRKRLLFLVAPLAVTGLAFALLASPVLRAAGSNAKPSSCVAGMQKSVSPSQVQPGDTARVTMIMTHTCAAVRRPVDIVILADVSSSMTRGRRVSAQPTGGSGDIGDPPPVKTVPSGPLPPLSNGINDFLALQSDGASPDQSDISPPSTRPGDDPSGCVPNDAANPGGPSNPVVPPMKTVPPPPGPPIPPDPSNPPGKTPEIPPGGGDSGGGLTPGRGALIEEPGNEDLIRETQRWLRKFLTQDQIERDMELGTLRVGLVAFNNRGRRLLSLTDDNRRSIARLGVLRGGGLTRIDIALRAAERDLYQPERGRINLRRNDDKRSKVILLISDGQFCKRDVSRARVDGDIDVIAVAAGRGANERKLRDIATEKNWVFQLRDLDIKEVMKLYNDTSGPDPINQDIAVQMTNLQIHDELSEFVDLVPGSVNPAPSTISGKTINWFFQPPTSPVTLTYDIQVNQPGQHPVSNSAGSQYADTLGRQGSADFPEVQIEQTP